MQSMKNGHPPEAQVYAMSFCIMGSLADCMPVQATNYRLNQRYKKEKVRFKRFAGPIPELVLLNSKKTHS